VCVLVLPLLFTLSLAGDTIELKTGERIEGAFKQATSAGVVVEVAGQSLTIALDQVKAIYFGATPQPASPAQSSAARDALDALKALRSVTNSGIAYRDYSQRVLDAKVKVDRYLSSAANDADALRNAIRLSMSGYQLASLVWNLRFSSQRNGEAEWPLKVTIARTLCGKLAISECPALRQWMDQVKADIAFNRYPSDTLNSASTRDHIIGDIAEDHPQVLWDWASAQLAEAERLLAQQ